MRNPCAQHGEVLGAIRGLKLNLGCGLQPEPGNDWVNVDHILQHPSVKKMDMLSFPWSFPDTSFHGVLMSHVIEHIPHAPVEYDGMKADALFLVLKEIWRICRDGAIVDIYTPDGTDSRFWDNAEHCRPVTLPSLKGLLGEFADAYGYRYQLVAGHIKKRKFYVASWLNAWHLERYLKIRRFGNMRELHIILRTAKEV